MSQVEMSQVEMSQVEMSQVEMSSGLERGRAILAGSVPVDPAYFARDEYGVTVRCALCGETYCEDGQGWPDAMALAAAVRWCGWRVLDGRPVCGHAEAHLRAALAAVVAAWDGGGDGLTSVCLEIEAARRLLASGAGR